MRNKTKKYIYAGLIWAMTMLFFNAGTVFADQMAGFNVQPIFPESQIEDSSGYFDLILSPGDSDEIGVMIENTTTDELTINITTHTAFTNVNGVVEYSQDLETHDPTLLIKLPDLIEGESQITLASGEKKQVNLELTMPEEILEGIVVGGIRIEEERDNYSSEETVSIENTISYVIGVVVGNHRSQLEPELELLDVFADQLNYRNVFSAHLQNPIGRFINQLEVEAKIYDVSQDEVLYQAERQGMQMAPNSNFKFPIHLDGDKFVDGTYYLHLIARSGSEEWEWKKEFEVNRQTATTLNQQDVTVDTSVNIWMILAIVLAILLLGFLGYHQRIKKNDFSV